MHRTASHKGDALLPLCFQPGTLLIMRRRQFIHGLTRFPGQPQDRGQRYYEYGYDLNANISRYALTNTNACPIDAILQGDENDDGAGGYPIKVTLHHRHHLPSVLFGERLILALIMVFFIIACRFTARCLLFNNSIRIIPLRF